MNMKKNLGSETQQSADISRLSNFQMGGSIQKLFTLFMSSQEDTYKKKLILLGLYLEKMVSLKIILKRFQKTLFIYHTVLPVLFQYVANLGGWDDDDKQDYLRAGLLGSINGLFIASDFIDTIFKNGSWNGHLEKWR